MNLGDAHAVVIGVSAYRHIRPLPAVEDGPDVAAVLDYPAGNVAVLLDGAATRAAILEALDRLAARTTASSTAFLYFSGHGGRTTRGGIETCYLMPVDAGWDDLDATAISGTELSSRLRAIGAGRVTVVLDCCRAAGIAEPKDVELDDLSRSALSPLAAGRGRAVIAASRGDGLAYVTPGQRNGLFTRHLLDGLRGGANSAGGVIRICDLFHYVQERVVAEQPGQRPVFKAELEENYPIARSPSVAPVVLPQLDDEFEYDVFVSYVRGDPLDKAWVEKGMVPAFERRGLRVFLEHRDARIPGTRLREMQRAVQVSRYTLAVLTPSYLGNGFADFQQLMAQHLTLELQRPRFIPVLRRPCALELGARMTNLLDLTDDAEVEAGLARLALALREPPRPRLDA